MGIPQTEKQTFLATLFGDHCMLCQILCFFTFEYKARNWKSDAKETLFFMHCNVKVLRGSSRYMWIMDSVIQAREHGQENKGVRARGYSVSTTHHQLLQLQLLQSVCCNTYGLG